jgi:hypothetical protein
MEAGHPQELAENRGQPASIHCIEGPSAAITGCRSGWGFVAWDDRAVRSRFVTALLLIAAVGCGLVAYLDRHVSLSSLSGFGLEGAYFNRSVGTPAYAGVFSGYGNWFDPFRFTVPYLWLGLAVGLLIGALAVTFVARTTPQINKP